VDFPVDFPHSTNEMRRESDHSGFATHAAGAMLEPCLLSRNSDHFTTEILGFMFIFDHF